MDRQESKQTGTLRHGSRVVRTLTSKPRGGPVRYQLSEVVPSFKKGWESKTTRGRRWAPHSHKASSKNSEVSNIALPKGMAQPLPFKTRQHYGNRDIWKWAVLWELWCMKVSSIMGTVVYESETGTVATTARLGQYDETVRHDYKTGTVRHESNALNINSYLKVMKIAISLIHQLLLSISSQSPQ